MTSEGRRSCWEGSWGSTISTIIGSEGVVDILCFFGDGSSSSSTSSTVTILDPLGDVEDSFRKGGGGDCFWGGLGDCKGKLTEPVSEAPLVDPDKWAGGRDLLLPFGSVASMMACIDISGCRFSSFICGCWDIALGLRVGFFVVGLTVLTGLAVW